MARAVLILVAMEVEERAIFGNLAWTNVQVSKRLGLVAKQHTEGVHSISVIQTGVGIANAAAAMALFAETQPITEIIQLGVGGALVPGLKAGDTIVANSVLQHDSLISRDVGTEPMAPGELYLSVSPSQRLPAVIQTDASLTVFLEKIMGPKAQKGLVLSGNEFVGSRQRKTLLAQQTPGALLVEMESAGIAQMARKMKIPFAVAKTVADELNPIQKDISRDYLNWIGASAKTAEMVISGLLLELGKY